MSVYDLVKGCSREADLILFFNEAERLSANLDYSVNRVCQELRCYSYKMKQTYESTEDYIAQHTGLRLYKIVRFLCFDISLSCDDFSNQGTVRGIRNFKKETEKFFGSDFDDLLAMTSEERYDIFINRHRNEFAAHSYLTPTMMTFSAAVVLYVNGLLDSFQKVVILCLVGLCIYALSLVFSWIAKTKNLKINQTTIMKDIPCLFLLQILLLQTIFIIEPFGYKVVLFIMASILLTFFEIRDFRGLKEAFRIVTYEVLNVINSIKNREKLSYRNGLTIMSLSLCLSLSLLIFNPLGGVISGILIGNVNLGIWLFKMIGGLLYLTAAIIYVVFSLKFDRYVSLKSVLIEFKNDITQLISILH